MDVRRPGEYAESHIDGAVNLPLHDLVRRADDVPAGELWVHCAGGYRASIAASMFAAAGRPVVAIDDQFDNAGTSGLTLTEQK